MLLDHRVCFVSTLILSDELRSELQFRSSRSSSLTRCCSFEIVDWHSCGHTGEDCSEDEATTRRPSKDVRRTVCMSIYTGRAEER